MLWKPFWKRLDTRTCGEQKCLDVLSRLNKRRKRTQVAMCVSQTPLTQQNIHVWKVWLKENTWQGAVTLLRMFAYRLSRERFNQLIERKINHLCYFLPMLLQ